MERKRNGNGYSGQLFRMKSPVEHDRKSTVAMFPPRGFANSPKLQVDVVNELDNNYDIRSDYNPDPGAFADPLTDAGGTVDYVY